MKDHILAFWEGQAELHKTNHSASWADEYMVSIERDYIESFLNSIKSDFKNVLDAGTSNGHSLVELARIFTGHTFSGFDYSPEMVNQCNNAIKDSGCQNIKNAIVGDVRDIPYESSSFDISFTTRVLINLPTWDDQKQGINELLRITKPGGKVLIMEGFWEPLSKLNSIRGVAGLEPLVEHDFNRYLKLSRLKDFLSEKNLEFQIEDFSSSYYLLTRFVREAIGADKIDQAYTSDFNRNAKYLHNQFSKKVNSGLGIQQAVVINS